MEVRATIEKKRRGLKSPPYIIGTYPHLIPIAAIIPVKRENL